MHFIIAVNYKKNKRCKQHVQLHCPKIKSFIHSSTESFIPPSQI